MGLLLAAVSAFTFLAGIMLWARHTEKKAYNNGFCSDCGQMWRHYDVDSQGGRGYTCDLCNKGIWVSYWGIDDDRHTERRGV